MPSITRIAIFPFLLIALVMVMASCRTVAVTSEVAGDEVRFEGPVYPEGTWNATVKGVSKELRPGEDIDWKIRYSMTGHEYVKVMAAWTAYQISTYL